MVYGLEKFKVYFEDHTNQYVLIGGAACDILMGELGVPFRATKDLDLVIILEALDNSFGKKFWQFITDGGYKQREKASGGNQFYRFCAPQIPEYPKMIELFSRKSDDFDLKFENGLTPIHIDEDIVSLSAILLDDVYYACLLGGRQVVDGYSVIDIETMILLKIKAWLDMKKKLDNGIHVDAYNINKHKNDIFRLLANISPSTQMGIPEEIHKDLILFTDKINKDRPDLQNLGIRGTSFEEQVELLRDKYLRIDEKSQTILG